MLREVLLKKDTWQFMYSFLRVLFIHAFFGSPSQVKADNLLQVRVEALFDRNNADFEMLKNCCNLYAHFNGEIMPFCQREIVRKRNMNTRNSHDSGPCRE